MNKDILKQIPKEELLTLPYFQNRGKYFLERCFIDDVQGVRERAFSDVIKAQTENTCCSSFIRTLCASDKEREIALAVFQWTSTNTGRSTLEEAIRAADKAEKEYK
tara:strand:+ start:521 stop:838 length:318 start_codon:yes stop_codon:yes gene_type:complete